MREFQRNRRQFLAGLGTMAGAAMLPRTMFAATKLNASPTKYNLGDITPQSKVTSYNNFIEFGPDKSDPERNAQSMHVRPWTIQVDGLVKQKKTIDIDTLMKLRPIEQRVYRFRCVEGWSMVVPWDGFSLGEFLKTLDPLPSAKFVQFFTLHDPKQMPGVNSSGVGPQGYSEGLRMDEAMHPLTLMTFGSYGETLANQQGAPIRIIVPWKYGFKSPKSIVRIRFVDKQPETTWNDLNAPAYGFYSNVNPSVAPWRSQERERVLGSGFLPKIVGTQPFNGYGNEVAHLYAGMDLRVNY